MSFRCDICGNRFKTTKGMAFVGNETKGRQEICQDCWGLWVPYDEQKALIAKERGEVKA